MTEFGTGLRARLERTDRSARNGKPKQIRLEELELGAARDLPLGTLVLQEGLLSAEQIVSALGEAVRSRRRLGEVLVDKGLVSRRDVARLLAEQRGFPFVDLRALELDPRASTLLPEPTARLLRSLPVGFVDGLPVIALADPTDERTIESVRGALDVLARFVVAPEEEILAGLSKVYAETESPWETPPKGPRSAVQGV